MIWDAGLLWKTSVDLNLNIPTDSTEQVPIISVEVKGDHKNKARKGGYITTYCPDVTGLPTTSPLHLVPLSLSLTLQQPHWSPGHPSNQPSLLYLRAHPAMRTETTPARPLKEFQTGHLLQSFWKSQKAKQEITRAPRDNWRQKANPSLKPEEQKVFPGGVTRVAGNSWTVAEAPRRKVGGQEEGLTGSHGGPPRTMKEAQPRLEMPPEAGLGGRNIPAPFFLSPVDRITTSH